MKINIKGSSVNYICYGNEKGKDIILLHGWGQNIEMMKYIGDRLSSDFHITILDFPGFGNSEEPKEAYSNDDYVEVVEELAKELKLKNPILIGHSFGGRIAIKYSSKKENNVSKVVLFGSPCIREQKKLPLKTRIFKKIKKIPGLKWFAEIMKNYIGSRDYKAASPIMRQVLVKTVNEDLLENAKKITAPTLLIWGDNDTEAPLYLAQKLEKQMKDAALIVLPGTHYAYLENLDQVIRILNSFLGVK